MPSPTPAAQAAAPVKPTATLPETLLPAAPTPAAPTPKATLSIWSRIENGAEWGISPDERWIWALEQGLVEGGQEYHTTHIISADGRVEWRVQLKPGDTGALTGAENEYRPFFWMPTEPYLFLVGSACCADGSNAFTSGLGLYRLNLENGQLSTIYPWGKYYHFSFSPTGKYLLSTFPGAAEVTITRLRDSSKVTVPLPESFQQAGGSQWAADGKHILMQVCVQSGSDPCGKNPVIVVDLEKSEFQTIVSDLKQAFALGEKDVDPDATWMDDQRVILIGPEYNLVYDLTTGLLKKR